MIEKAADVGVMQCLRCRGVPIGGSDFRVGHERLDQPLEMRILERGYESRQSFPEFVHVLGGLGKVVSEVDLGFPQLAKLVNRELKSVLVLVNETFNLEE